MTPHPPLTAAKLPLWAFSLLCAMGCGARSELDTTAAALPATPDAGAPGGAQCSESWTLPYGPDAGAGGVDVFPDGTVAALVFCAPPAPTTPHTIVGSGRNALLFIDCAGRIQLERRFADTWGICHGGFSVSALDDGSVLVGEVTLKSPSSNGMIVRRYGRDGSELFTVPFDGVVSWATRRDGRWYALGSCGSEPLCSGSHGLFLAAFDGSAVTKVRIFPWPTSIPVHGLAMMPLVDGGVLVTGTDSALDTQANQAISGGPGRFVARLSPQFDIVGIAHGPENVRALAGRGDLLGYAFAGGFLSSVSSMGIDCSTEPCPGNLLSRYSSTGELIYARTFEPIPDEAGMCLDPDGSLSVLGWAPREASFGPFKVAAERNFVGELSPGGAVHGVVSLAAGFVPRGFACDPGGTRVLSGSSYAPAMVGTFSFPEGDFVARGRFGP